jgi:uncharacterized protein YjgD (DUF1641 family)
MMAKPIAIAPDPARSQAPRDELRRRLESAPIEHAEALLALWDLLEAAHARHVLEIARGALSTSDEILERLAKAAGSESSIRALRNAILLGEMLGSLDPEMTGSVLHSVRHALASTQDELRSRPSPSLVQIVARLTSRDARAAYGLLANLFAALGRALLPAAKPQLTK